VRLDITEEEARNEQGSLHLLGDSGGYDQTIPIAGHFVPNATEDGTVDVLFEKVPTKPNYTLTYIASDGTETTLVKDAAFSSLNDQDTLPSS
jgi:hypothetical protein